MRRTGFRAALHLVLGCVGSVAVEGQVIVGTADAGDRAWHLPNPDLARPGATIDQLVSIPADAQPHGIAFFGPGLALLADFDGDRVFVVDPSTDTLLRTIDASASGSTWRGLGSIAVSPNGDVALASGDVDGVSTGLCVIENPFAASPLVRFVSLGATQHVKAWQTAAIRFAPDGRAFVATHHRDYVYGAASPNSSFVHVVDPPYTTITASIALPVGTATTSNFDHAEGLALAPDGETLLVANDDRELYVLRAPFAAGMPVETLALGGTTRCASSVGAIPDGSGAFVTDYCPPSGGDRVQVVLAPYSSLAGSFALNAPPGAATQQGFEHVAFSPDGRFAYLSGGVGVGEEGDLWVVEAPFTPAGASSAAVALPTGERGAGAVEIVDDRLFGDTFASGDLTRWSSFAP